MTKRGHHTLTEITTQPTAWADALQAFATLETAVQQTWAKLAPKQVVFTGCGSTYYLSQAAASLFQELTGVPSCAYPGSEIALRGAQVLHDPRHTLLVTISRSGTTTETLAAVDHFRRLDGACVWSITCYPQSDLAQAADLVLPAEAAQEGSVAQTRSFASMLVLAQALAATIAGKDTALLSALPELGNEILAQTAPLAENLGSSSDLDRFFFLGLGAQYGVACEAMLKMKEMSLTYSEAFHTLEFRHGPMSMVTEHALIVGLLSQATLPHERKVLDDMRALGGKTLAFNTTGSISTTHTITLPNHLPSWAMPVLYLPPLQLMAYHRSMSKGLNPDNPQNLTAVIYLDREAFK